MKSVEPIRDKKKIDAMKAILASGKFGAFFDRDQYSVSNLRFKTVEIK